MRALLSSGILILIIAVIATHQYLIEDLNIEYPLSPSARKILVQQLTYGLRWFSKELLEAVTKKDENNLVVSPFGLSVSLAMTQASTRLDDDTKREIESILVLNGLDESKKRTGYQTIIDQFNSHKLMKLRVANSLFAPINMNFNIEYITSCRRAFHSSVNYVDFNQSNSVIHAINQFSQTETHRLIKKIIKIDDINENLSSPRIVDVNTIYFKGEWVKKFNACSEYGCPIVSSIRKSETSVPQMWGKHVVRYRENYEINAKYIELPYLSDNRENSMSMFILLPNERNGLAYLEENLHKIDIIKLRDDGDYRTVNIQLPKFRIENEIEFKEPFERMNISNIMNLYEGEFYLNPGQNRYYIHKYAQKSFIEINEEGSEATAATWKVFRPTSDLFFPSDNLYIRPDEDLVEYATEEPFERVQLAPCYTASVTMTEFGSEDDAEHDDEVDFIADHSFFVIITPMNDNPSTVFAARVIV